MTCDAARSRDSNVIFSPLGYRVLPDDNIFVLHAPASPKDPPAKAALTSFSIRSSSPV